MTKKIRIVEGVNQLGLGGTEYALQLYAKFLDKSRFEVVVLSLLKGGERETLIREMGIEVIVLNGDYSKLPAILEQADVFHWHGGGSIDPQLFEVVKKNKPSLVIQTNVFGSYDASPYYKYIDYDLYISKMILVRRMSLDKDLVDNYAAKRKVLHYPIDTNTINATLPSTEVLSKFKLDNKLDQFFIIGRIGRADDNKFDLIALDGFAHFAKHTERARFLLIGATPKMRAHAEHLKIADKVIIMENTVSLQRLIVYYKSMDVFLMASQIGESFGMVIAEAMTVGTPVLTISTEDRDNAQIELMDNEKSGLVVKRSKYAIARALHFLHQNKATGIELSEQAKLKISRDYKAQNIVGSLERLILNHFSQSVDHISEKSLIQDYSPEMVNDYLKRCINTFGRSNIWKRILWLFKRKIGDSY
jgi:glycosyltransferase involved in cell wall biosynthesis